MFSYNIKFIFSTIIYIYFMSSNRLIYDTCAYATDVKESVGPLEYNLYKGKYEQCKQCPVGDFTNNIAFESRADVENELFGLARPNTLCPSLKYNPLKPFNTPNFSPPTMCANIYHITPNNLEKPKTNMLNENNLGVNYCNVLSNSEN